jgi:DNA polymerase-1
VLNALAERHKLPRLLLEYRQLAKLKNTYVDALPGLVDEKTGRVHTSFNQAATETGRLSSSNPNLQNLPVKTEIGRTVRQAVVAPPGHLLVSCDYSQVELRILAHLAQDENLSRAFCAGKDIHCATAALIYGAEEADVSDEMRETAKRVNFGIVYGLTAYGLSRDLLLPPQQAQAFIDAYFLRYPRVQDYIRSQIESCRRDGFVKTLLGRRRYIPEINNKNQAIRQFAERQAVNTPIQGTAADLIKLAMVALHRAIQQKGLAARMVLQVHDELVFEVAQGEVAALAQLAKEKMEAALKLSVPLKVDIKVGKNWLEMEEL